MTLHALFPDGSNSLPTLQQWFVFYQFLTGNLLCLTFVADRYSDCAHNKSSLTFSHSYKYKHVVKLWYVYQLVFSFSGTSHWTPRCRAPFTLGTACHCYHSYSIPVGVFRSALLLLNVSQYLWCYTYLEVLFLIREVNH